MRKFNFLTINLHSFIFIIIIFLSFIIVNVSTKENDYSEKLKEKADQVFHNLQKKAKNIVMSGRKQIHKADDPTMARLRQSMVIKGDSTQAEEDEREYGEHEVGIPSFKETLPTQNGLSEEQLELEKSDPTWHDFENKPKKVSQDVLLAHSATDDLLITKMELHIEEGSPHVQVTLKSITRGFFYCASKEHYSINKEQNETGKNKQQNESKNPLKKKIRRKMSIDRDFDNYLQLSLFEDKDSKKIELTSQYIRDNGVRSFEKTSNKNNFETTVVLRDVQNSTETKYDIGCIIESSSSQKLSNPPEIRMVDFSEDLIKNTPKEKTETKNQTYSFAPKADYENGSPTPSSSPSPSPSLNHTLIELQTARNRSSERLKERVRLVQSFERSPSLFPAGFYEGFKQAYDLAYRDAFKLRGEKKLPPAFVPPRAVPERSSALKKVDEIAAIPSNTTQTTEPTPEPIPEPTPEPRAGLGGENSGGAPQTPEQSTEEEATPTQTPTPEEEEEQQQGETNETPAGTEEAASSNEAEAEAAAAESEAGSAGESDGAAGGTGGGAEDSGAAGAGGGAAGGGADASGGAGGAGGAGGGDAAGGGAAGGGAAGGGAAGGGAAGGAGGGGAGGGDAAGGGGAGGGGAGGGDAAGGGAATGGGAPASFSLTRSGGALGSDFIKGGGDDLNLMSKFNFRLIPHLRDALFPHAPEHQVIHR